MYLFLYLILNPVMYIVRVVLFNSEVKMETIKKKDKSVVQIYLTEKQKQQLKQLAAKEGMTMTGYVVDVIRQNSK